MKKQKENRLFGVRFRAMLDSARRNTEQLLDANSPEFRKLFEEELKKREELTRPLLESIEEMGRITEKDLNTVVCNPEEFKMDPALTAPFRTPPPTNLHIQLD